MPTPPPDPTRTVTRLFWCWLVARTVVWVLAVVGSHPNAPLDLIEWLSWGHVWQWGYPKHPPLPAWLADAAARCAPGRVWPVYVLGYAFTALTLLAAWRLARDFLPPRSTLLAVVCLDGVMYLTNDPAEYSNNVVLNTGWAWLAVAGHRAIRTGSGGWWLAAGAALGLTLLAKYTVGVLAVCLVGYTLWDRTARRGWRTPGPYLAAGVALLLVCPHLLWLRDHRFLTLRYAADRSTEQVVTWARLFFPAQFLGGQLLHLLPVLVVLGPVLRRVWPRHEGGRGADPRFLDFVVIGPVGVLVAVSVASGGVLREIWGSPLWAFVGVWLLARFGRAEADVRWRAAGWRWAAVAAAFVTFTVVKQTAGPHLTGKAQRPHFPGRRLADEVNRLWAERYGGRPPVIGGEAWRAGNVACYSPHRPKVFTSGVMGHLVMEEIHCPWTNDAEVNSGGAAIVWDADVVSAERLDALRIRFPRFELLPVIELPAETTARVPPVRVGAGFVPPVGRRHNGD